MSNKDDNTDYSQLTTALGFILDQRFKELHTAVPGLVINYTPSTRRATVQSAIQMRLTDGQLLSRPAIANVPVIHPSGGGYTMHVPLVKGDPVLLIFSERGISAFKARAHTEAPPDQDALLSEKDAIAIPGFGPQSITPSGNGLVAQTNNGDTWIEVNQGVINIEAATINITGDTNITGDVTIVGPTEITGDTSVTGAAAISGGLTNAGKDVGSTHTHSGVDTGPGSTGPPN